MRFLRKLGRRRVPPSVTPFASSSRLLWLASRATACDARELADCLAESAAPGAHVVCFVFAELMCADVCPPYDALANQIVDVSCLRGDDASGAVLTPTLLQLFRACQMIDYWLALDASNRVLLVGGASFAARHLAVFAVAYAIYTDDDADVDLLLAESAAATGAPVPLPFATSEVLKRFAAVARRNASEFVAPRSIRITTLSLRGIDAAATAAGAPPPTLLVLNGGAVVFSSAAAAASPTAAQPRWDASTGELVVRVDVDVCGDFAVVCNTEAAAGLGGAAAAADRGDDSGARRVFALTTHTDYVGALPSRASVVHRVEQLDLPPAQLARFRRATLELGECIVLYLPLHFVRILLTI